jgi:ankyrin repeat protein
MMTPIAIVLIAFLASSISASAGPLHDAASAGDVEKVGVVLGPGVDVDARSDRGETPLILAILGGHGAVAELLIEQGAAIDGRNAGGFTPLHAAAYAGDAAMAELLIAKGADIHDAKNKASVTPLFVAAEEDRRSVAELLLARGAAVDAKERHGYTVLTRTVFKEHEDMVELLKAHGAECQPPEIMGEASYRQCMAASN